MINRKFFNNSGEGVIVLLILLSLVAGTVVLIKKNIPKPEVAIPAVTQQEVTVSNMPVLSFAADPVPAGSGDTFDLILKVNPNGVDFHAFELYVGYDPAKVDFQDSAKPAANISSSYPLITSAVDSENTIISIIGTRTGSSFSGSKETELARVKMKKKADVADEIAFFWGETTKLGNRLPLQKLNRIFEAIIQL